MSPLLVTNTEIERALDTLPEGQRVSLGVEDRPAGWFRGQVRQTGGWLDLRADVCDLSANGLGLSLDREVALDERVSLSLELPDGQGLLRARLVIRHAAQAQQDRRWQAGGEFQAIAADDQERLIRFVFARLRAQATA